MKNKKMENEKLNMKNDEKYLILKIMNEKLKK
jgi:hypothetical protein